MPKRANSPNRCRRNSSAFGGNTNRASKVHYLPPSFRFPPLREGNRARVRFPLRAGGTLRRGSSTAVFCELWLGDWYNSPRRAIGRQARRTPAIVSPNASVSGAGEYAPVGLLVATQSTRRFQCFYTQCLRCLPADTSHYQLVIPIAQTEFTLAPLLQVPPASRGEPRPFGSPCEQGEP